MDRYPPTIGIMEFDKATPSPYYVLSSKENSYSSGSPVIYSIILFYFEALRARRPQLGRDQCLGIKYYIWFSFVADENLFSFLRTFVFRGCQGNV